MAYAPVSTAVGVNFRGPLVDYRFGRVYGFGGSPDGFRYFDLYPNGNEIRARSVADAGVVGNFGPWAMCYNSQYFACVASASNGALISYMRSTDFTFITSFGAADSSFTNNTIHIEQPNCIVAIQDPVREMDILLCNSAFTDGAINAVTVGGLNQVLGAVDENHTVLGAVPDGSGTVAYAIGYTKLGGATQIGLYALKPGIVGIAKVLPTQIDAAWSHIDQVNGISIDQTDGNIIAGITNTTDSPTHPAYLVKFNVTTGAVMWAIAVGAGISGDNDDSMKQNLITRGTLYYLGSTLHSLYTINTVTGAFTIGTLDAAVVGPLHVTQMSEDVTGSVIWWGSWSEGATHPEYLGTYCLTQGHTSGSDLIWRFFPGGKPNPAPTYGIPAQSRRRAWSFTADGHVFYALDLGQEGTWVFDDSTQQWSQFITAGFNGWNLTNGTVWGQRIVGGDMLTGDMWEMRPGALQDNDAVSITHVVTGGLQTRERGSKAVAGLWLTGSVGQQQDTGGAAVTLSFSDDQGKSWVTMDTLPLVEGTFTELAWRSLGSFDAPGRIFKITDVGGLLRIDGCDAALDNFNEDGNTKVQGG